MIPGSLGGKELREELGEHLLVKDGVEGSTEDQEDGNFPQTLDLEDFQEVLG